MLPLCQLDDTVSVIIFPAALYSQMNPTNVASTSVKRTDLTSDFNNMNTENTRIIIVTLQILLTAR